VRLSCARSLKSKRRDSADPKTLLDLAEAGGNSDAAGEKIRIAIGYGGQRRNDELQRFRSITINKLITLRPIARAK